MALNEDTTGVTVGVAHRIYVDANDVLRSHYGTNLCEDHLIKSVGEVLLYFYWLKQGANYKTVAANFRGQRGFSLAWLHKRIPVISVAIANLRQKWCDGAFIWDAICHERNTAAPFFPTAKLVGDTVPLRTRAHKFSYQPKYATHVNKGFNLRTLTGYLFVPRPHIYTGTTNDSVILDDALKGSHVFSLMLEEGHTMLLDGGFYSIKDVVTVPFKGPEIFAEEAKYAEKTRFNCALGHFRARAEHAYGSSMTQYTCFDRPWAHPFRMQCEAWIAFCVSRNVRLSLEYGSEGCYAEIKGEEGIETLNKKFDAAKIERKRYPEPDWSKKSEERSKKSEESKKRPTLFDDEEDICPWKKARRDNSGAREKDKEKEKARREKAKANFDAHRLKALSVWSEIKGGERKEKRETKKKETKKKETKKKETKKKETKK